MKTDPEVLLVDDNLGDLELTSEVLRQTQQRFHVSTVSDGLEAISFLRRQGKYVDAPNPDLIVLDLNMPRKDGRGVLAEVKADPRLSRIPIVVFTTSQADSDISGSYELGANCYLTKPGNLTEFVTTVQSMADFWLGCASLPNGLPKMEKQ